MKNATFTLRLVETDLMAEVDQPVLSLVSRSILTAPRRIIGRLERSGHALLLFYALQQIAQFRSRGEEFAMQHADTASMLDYQEKLYKILQGMPIETRLHGLSADEILQHYGPQLVFRWFTIEQFVEALSDEQAERLCRALKEREACKPDPRES